MTTKYEDNYADFYGVYDTFAGPQRILDNPTHLTTNDFNDIDELAKFDEENQF